MSAIKINVSESGRVSVSYEEKTSENIGRRLEELKHALRIDNYGVATLLNMKPNDSSVRLFKRWQTSPENTSYQEMPEHKWKLLLVLVEGQDPIK